MTFIDKTAVRKILIIKFRGIGDVILSTVILDNLKNDFPHAQIDFLTEKPSDQFLASIPSIDNIILFERKSIFKRVIQIKTLRKNNYDLILDLYSNPTTAIYTFLSGARYKAGFPYRGRKYAYNLFGPEDRGIHHSADLHLKLLENIGIKTGLNKLHYNLTEEDKTFARNVFNEIHLHKNIIGICPGGGWPSKKCEPVKFAEIADALSDKFKTGIMVFWGPNDKKDADEIIKSMKNKAYLAPETSINQMAALINLCSICIANDSGPMHISTAVGTPTLSIHGPTDPKLQGPYGAEHETVILHELDCIICNELVCPKNHECFFDLPVERVMKKVDILIEKNKIDIKVK